MDSLMAHQTKGPNSQSGIGSVLSTGQSSQDMGPDSQELDLSCPPESPQDMGSVSQSGTGSVLSTSHLRTWDQSVSQELDLSCQLDSHLRTWDQSVRNWICPVNQTVTSGHGTRQELDLSCQPDSHLRTWDQTVRNWICPVNRTVTSGHGTSQSLRNWICPVNWTVTSGHGTRQKRSKIHSLRLHPRGLSALRLLAPATHLSHCRFVTRSLQSHWPVALQLVLVLPAGRQLQGSHLPTYRSASLYSYRVHTCQHTGQLHFTDSCRVYTCQHTGQLHFTVTGFTAANIQVSFILQLQGSHLPSYRSASLYSYRVQACQHTGQFYVTVTGFTPANIQVSFTLQLEGSLLPTYRSASLYRQLQGSKLATYRSASLYRQLQGSHICQLTCQLHFTVTLQFVPLFPTARLLYGSHLARYRSTSLYSDTTVPVLPTARQLCGSQVQVKFTLQSHCSLFTHGKIQVNFTLQ